MTRKLKASPPKPPPVHLQPPRGPKLHAAAIRPPTATLADWYWRVVTYDGGREHTAWTGRLPAGEVPALLWRLVAEGAHVQRPQQADSHEVEVVTVADLLALWRGHIAHERPDLAPGTVTTYLHHSRALEAVLGQVLLDQLARQDLDRYRAQVARGSAQGRRRSPGTVALDMMVIDAAWKWGRSVGAVPSRDLDVPRVSPTRVRERYTPTAGEVAAVAGHLIGWPRDLVQLQWATGARVGELLALTAADVELDRAELVVGRHVGARKTGARRVPIHPDTVPLLARLVADAGPQGRLWSGTSGGSTARLNTLLREATAELKQPAWTTHALRRAYVVRAIRQGIDVAVLSTITGHSVAELLKTYREVQDSDRRDAVKKLPGKLPAGRVVSLRGGGDPHT